MKKLKEKSMGFISVDAGDIVCFSVDSVMRIMEDSGNDIQDFITDVDGFIRKYNGVECGFGADGGYEVVKCEIVSKYRNEAPGVYNVVMIGLPNYDEIEFLEDSHPTYREFLDSKFGERTEYGHDRSIWKKEHRKELDDAMEEYMKLVKNS